MKKRPGMVHLKKHVAQKTKFRHIWSHCSPSRKNHRSELAKVQPVWRVEPRMNDANGDDGRRSNNRRVKNSRVKRVDEITFHLGRERKSNWDKIHVELIPWTIFKMGNPRLFLFILVLFKQILRNKTSQDSNSGRCRKRWSRWPPPLPLTFVIFKQILHTKSCR